MQTERLRTHPAFVTFTELHSFAFVILHIHSVEPGKYFMKLTQALFGITLASALALAGQAQSAQAFNLKLTKGADSPTGIKTQGAYSEFAGLSTVKTVNFNASNKLPSTSFAKYSFQAANNISSIKIDKWGPSGANGEANTSNHLDVNQGNNVTIKLGEKISYFGINWGAMSDGNTLSFYNGDKLITFYSTETVAPLALNHVKHHAGEGNGYAHFSASNKTEMFDRIVLSQVGKGGFESDNHSFSVKAVPEPGIMLGLAAIGGSVWAKRKRR